jgi:hypothetical protein
MMHSKMAIYVLLAVGLGYFLISTVPMSLVPGENEVFQTGENDEFLSEDKEFSGFDSNEQTRTKKGFIIFDPFQYIVISLNFIISIGVYIIAKKKFS